jgi:hypothetical protein
MTGFENKKNLGFENANFWRPFFSKSCLFLRTGIDNLPSNFIGSTIQCISIDWYPETNLCMFYAAVRPPRSPQKVTDWSGTKKWKTSKKIRLSRYQSIDKIHFWVYVKFEVGLSIPFTRKMRFKEVRVFPRSVHPVYKKNEIQRSESFPKVCPFFKLINEKSSLRWKKDGSSPV